MLVGDLKTVVKRDGKTVPYNRSKIENVLIAISFDCDSEINSDKLEVYVNDVEEMIFDNCTVEEIQSAVEKVLILNNEFDYVSYFIRYREKRAIKRRLENNKTSKVYQYLQKVSNGLDIDLDFIFENIVIPPDMDSDDLEVFDIILLSVTPHIEEDEEYDVLAVRILVDKINKEVSGNLGADAYSLEGFKALIELGLSQQIYSYNGSEEYNLDEIYKFLDGDKSYLFDYQGLKCCYTNNLTKDRADRIIETPQTMYLRVAMGLGLNEKDRINHVKDTYELLSLFLYTQSSPTFFNSFMVRPQTASCYVLSMEDSINGIFNLYKQNANLSKYAGGIANDWTQVRSAGAKIHGTNGRSLGIVPFLKILSDEAIAVNQSGRRQGSIAAYLEIWHSDILDFLLLKRETGDDRIRAKDINTATWINDLFMERVKARAKWSLFNPNEVRDLCDLYGEEFEERYKYYESLGKQGLLETFTEVDAYSIFKENLVALAETGGGWPCFKDTTNKRNPSSNTGIIRSSNLCTEITLNTSVEETAVCMLSTVNVRKHLFQDGSIDLIKLERTVSTTIRNLDNLVEYNFYPTKESEYSNSLYRPVGLGLIGLQDALSEMKISFSSKEAVDFSDRFQEALSYFAIKTSCLLAKERGKYLRYAGSTWDRGLMPQDTYKEMMEGKPRAIDVKERMDWDSLRALVKEHGMRNSCVTTQPPTATVSLLTGSSQSTEAIYQNYFIKSNKAGQFVNMNKYLRKELKELGLWNKKTLIDIKKHSGVLTKIPYIPNDIKDRYAVSFDIDPYWILSAAAHRQIWIDQSQSTNLYAKNPTGAMLYNIYMMAWEMGLKTTYYLRTLSADVIEDDTSSLINSVCSLDPDCESCQ